MTSYDNYRPEIPYASGPATPQQETPRNGSERQQTPKPQPQQKKKPALRKTAVNPKPKKEKAHGPKRDIVGTVKAWAASLNVRLIAGVFLACAAIYLAVSFLSYLTDCVHDQAKIHHQLIGEAVGVANLGGEGGARLSELLINESFGLGSVVIVFWLMAMSLKLLTGRPRFKSVDFTIKSIVALVTVSLIIGLLTISLSTPVNWGGYHGRYVNEFIVHMAGWSGAALLCLFMVSVFVVICMRDLILWIMRLHRRHMARKREAARIKAEEAAKKAEYEAMRRAELHDEMKTGETADANASEAESAEEDQRVSFSHRRSATAAEDDNAPIYALPPSETMTVTNESAWPKSPFSSMSSEAASVATAPASDSAEHSDPLSEAIHEAQAEAEETSDSTDASSDNNADDAAESTMVVNVNQIGQTEKKHYRAGEDHRDGYKYKYPPFELLKPGVERIVVDENEQLENKEKIQKTLLDFKIPITQISATVGPTVTLYEIVPDKGVKISKIRGLVDDIALSLSAIGVRIIAPIPGKGTVGIEVANKDPQTVSMRTVIRSNKFQQSHYELPVALGSTISNDVYIADLAKMPHLLVAGATGQGKSVGLNAIVASLLYCKTPDELKFVMIDPKQVEFSLYAKLKNHYMAMLPGEDECVVTDTSKVEAILSSLCIEMDARYQLLKFAGVRKITEYNEKYRQGKLNPAEGHKFLPYIVVIVDEFSDLIMMSGKNVELPIARLAQKARAVGMHVIIATQRPSTNVITGIIKANFPARIAFKVSSGVDSKTILDATGAQQLIGRGDMLIANNSETVRVQCAFIDTPEVEEICGYIERQPYPTGPYMLPEPKVEGNDEEAVTYGSSERDPLFEEAVRKVVSSGVASASSLQRHYSIGYNRAGKIMDQMEKAGIVGPSRDGKPRQVLINDPMMLDTLLDSLQTN